MTIIKFQILKLVFVALILVQAIECRLGRHNNNKNNKDPDCLYNRCEYKINPGKYSGHAPCQTAGGRVRIRDVDCADGNTYHICCKQPLRADIQRSRQSWFRAVTAIGGAISRRCMKLMLCEQSCVDGLSGVDGRVDYPQVMTTDDERHQEFVGAWNEGENQACYALHTDYTEHRCYADCAAKYGECANEMADSFVLQAFHWSGRVFHRLGVWCFAVLHANADRLHDFVGHAVTVKHAVRQVWSEWSARMTRTLAEFEAYRAETGSTLATGAAKERQWRQFLVVHNRSDAVMVAAVYDSLGYGHFTEAAEVINQTLATADFGPSSSASVMGLGLASWLTAIVASVWLWWY